MELQALLVLCGVGVAGLAMLLLMGLFSTSGTSYEEAIAQQRRATTELLALADSKNKPKKKEKKANKKQAKKEKNKDAAAATGSEVESEAPAESGMEDDSVPPAKAHVEFSPPVVVDVPRDTPPNVKIRKRGKDPKVKPILLNKEDPSCVSDPNALPDTVETVSNHFEEMHPKDEFELMHSALVVEKASEKVEEPVEKKENKSLKSAKTGKAAAKSAAPVDVVKEVTRERHNSGESAKEQRKGKKNEKKAVSEEVVEVVREEVVPPLNVPQPSELTTDKLLKHALAQPAPPAASPPSGKNKKKKPEPNVLSMMAGDSAVVNVGELVRVVKEASLSRSEIQILTDALLNKHHDPLPEHSEWTEGPNDPMQKLKKQLADKDKALADEIEASQALSAKLKELRAALNAERARLAAAAGAARAELHTHQARLQRLLDDNHQLAQDKLLLQSKLSVEGEVQAQRVQMEMHIQRLSESEAGLAAQVSALQAELSALALEGAQLRCEAAAARDQLLMAQQHAADLAQQLQEANRACGELEQARQVSALGEQRAIQELRTVQDRLAGITELQNEVQRLASHAQKAEANVDKVKEESEKQKQQMSSEISSLREQLSLRESELAEMKQMKAVPAQNGLPTNTNDQIKASELAKVESIVESLRDELSAAQRSSRDQKEQIARLQEQLAHYQLKNNELRTKNWKVMEALQSAEKALQTKSSSAMPAQDSLREAIAKAQEAQYKEVASILRTACPSAAPASPAASGDSEWLHSFARNLAQQLHKVEADKSATLDTDVEERLKDLTAQNEYSQSLVEKYKKIIEDTEGVLSRLQQNVTSEEQRWAQQLADKQRELDDLRQRTVLQMQNKIDTLQAELHQVKASNQNHTFADSERLAEERLLQGFTDKHNVDLSNGPFQMGLEKK